MNKEEIIRRLKKISEHAVHVTGEPPFIMSLDDGIALNEAVRLLKEQEAKPVIAEKRRVIWDDSYDETTYFEDTFYHCPSCNRILSRTHMKKSIHFCEECGQEVEWNDESRSN